MTGTNESGSVYQPSSKIRGWSATWNTGLIPCSTNADQMRSWSGCDSGRPSTGAGATIAMRMPWADASASCALEPVDVAEADVGDGVEATTALDGDGVAPAVPRRHVGQHRRQVRRQATLPQQPEVREADRRVQTHLVEPRHPRRGLPVLARKGGVVVVGGAARRPGTARGVDRTRRCRRGGGRRPAATARPATSTTCTRARRRSGPGRRRGATGRCGPATSNGARTGADPSRWFARRPVSQTGAFAGSE